MPRRSSQDPQLAALLAVLEPPDADQLRALLQAGASPDTRDEVGAGILALAAAIGAAELVEALLDYGATVDLVDEETGMTALFHAADARGGDLEADHGLVIDLLLGAGANPDLATRWGETPLIRAIQRQRIDLARRLIGRMRNLAQRDLYGRTALDYVLRQGGEAMELVMLLDTDP